MDIFWLGLCIAIINLSMVAISRFPWGHGGLKPSGTVDLPLVFGIFSVLVVYFIGVTVRYLSDMTKRPLA